MAGAARAPASPSIKRSKSSSSATQQTQRRKNKTMLLSEALNNDISSSLHQKPCAPFDDDISPASNNSSGTATTQETKGSTSEVVADLIASPTPSKKKKKKKSSSRSPKKESTSKKEKTINATPISAPPLTVSAPPISAPPVYAPVSPSRKQMSSRSLMTAPSSSFTAQISSPQNTRKTIGVHQKSSRSLSPKKESRNGSSSPRKNKQSSQSPQQMLPNSLRNSSHHANSNNNPPSRRPSLSKHKSSASLALNQNGVSRHYSTRSLLSFRSNDSPRKASGLSKPSNDHTWGSVKGALAALSCQRPKEVLLEQQHQLQKKLDEQENEEEGYPRSPVRKSTKSRSTSPSKTAGMSPRGKKKKPACPSSPERRSPRRRRRPSAAFEEDVMDDEEEDEHRGPPVISIEFSIDDVDDEPTAPLDDTYYAYYDQNKSDEGSPVVESSGDNPWAEHN